jgi:hypothetical protein
VRPQHLIKLQALLHNLLLIRRQQHGVSIPGSLYLQLLLHKLSAHGTRAAAAIQPTSCTALAQAQTHLITMHQPHLPCRYIAHHAHII